MRYLTGDDVDQQTSAGALLERLTPTDPGFVSREVAVELVWVLSHSYGLSRGRIADIFEQLLDTSGLLFESGADVSRAAAAYGRGGPEFADRMILAAAERAGAAPLFTFDRGLTQVGGATAVPEPSTWGNKPVNPTMAD